MILPAWVQIVPEKHQTLAFHWYNLKEEQELFNDTGTNTHCFEVFSVFIHNHFWYQELAWTKSSSQAERWGNITEKASWANWECTMTHSHFLNVIFPKEHRSVSHYANNTSQWLQVTKQLVSLMLFSWEASSTLKQNRKKHHSSKYFNFKQPPLAGMEHTWHLLDALSFTFD